MKKSYIAIFHIVFWLPYLFQPISFIYVFSKLTSPSNATFNVRDYYLFSGLNSGISIIADAAIFYFFYFYLFPRYLNNQRIKNFVYAGFIAGLIICLFNVTASHILSGSFNLPTALSKVTNKYPLNVVNDIAIFFKLMALGITGSMLRGFIAWYNDIHYKKVLENRNLQTELALLKAQINPHFLFNTLNNIDILIEKNAETASIYLKKLSDLLRFTLYESPAETIPLSREIAGIEQYIDLQKIRTSNANFVKFEVKGNIDELYIAPMIFMPFVENAFKHSTNKKVEDAIEILIDINGDEINFSCVNVFDNTQALQQPNSGLGLELINNRLNLFYQGNHQLTISKENNLFSVNLMIRADDH
ncbi:MAG: sensor histidine kinase [Mucilaginibacter sp.]|uniref:sensor histidine kinase n=1 Tax=Mucilaginibacter sp. TaxID=1882438 RepID=UPI0032671DFE